MAATVAKVPGLKLVIEERRNRELQMRMGGMSLPQIARQMGVSLSTVKRDMKAVYERLVANQIASAEEMRALELERLDQLQLSLWTRAMGDPKNKIPGDFKATDRVLAIMKQRAELAGLDAPTKLEHSFAEVNVFLKLLEQKGLSIPDIFQLLAVEFQNVKGAR